MRQYEVTYLVSDNVSESEITKVTGKIGGYISDEGGKVLKEESWGRRKLAYPINKQLFATYITCSFELEPDKLRALEQEIKHENDVIRHLLIVKDFGKETLTLTAEDIAATEEIEKVVGGEKSFEAIEGETDESLDLMAVRGEDDEETGELENQRTEEQKIEAPVEEKKEEAKVKEPAVEEAPEKKSEEIHPVESAQAESQDATIPQGKKPVKKAATKKPAVKKETKKIEPEIEKVVEPKAEKVQPVESAKAEPQEAVIPQAKKPVKKKAVKKDDSASDEADRLAKLNEELDEILGEDL